MNCWHCQTELIWGGDHSYEDFGMEGEGIVSNFTCPKCKAYVEFYKGENDEWAKSFRRFAWNYLGNWT